MDQLTISEPATDADQADPSGERDLVSALLQENARLQERIIEEQKRADLYQGVFHSMSDAMLIADQDRKIRICNSGVTTVFGHELEDLIGQSTAVLYESQSEFEAQGRERFNLSAEEKCKPYNVRYRTKNDSLFIGETIGTSIRGNDGELLGFLGAIRDVTRREKERSEVFENEQLLNLIANSLPGLVLYLDHDEVIRFVNSTGEQWYNSTRQDLIGAKIEDVLGDTAAGVVRPLLKSALGGTTVKKRRTVTYPDGVQRHVEISYVPDINADGSVNGVVALVIDVSTQQKAETELLEAQRRFSDAIEAIPDGFAYYDSDDRLQIFNSQYYKMYPQSADLIRVGNTFEEIIRGGAARGQYIEAIGCEDEWVRERLKRHKYPKDAIEMQLEDGRWVKVEERRTCDGGIVGVRIDITELKQREAELRRLSSTDHLTGLENRRGFLAQMEDLQASAQKNRRLLAVLLIDIDRFKSINDTYGHAAGDEILREVSILIAQELRGQDRACRYGGEEFAVLLPDTSLGGAHATAERIRQIIEQREFTWDNTAIQATISVGVAQIDDRDDRYEDGLCRADEALYEAKNSGRNQVRVSIRPQALATSAARGAAA